ncbi:nitrate/nitrite two-component system sensor histidine kinase NarQ [Paraferrimonas sedimenticola]|uniref:Sensor protein n=1 Tax=Paraferrimonas sedimenticola TaxID=375674 RepID=A0AA37VUM6_9GAMM|nr:nitrate/nitrite two-component system sensor histidine kinase NarQ [Paraferrimonas sedimenticola]GLP95771.1 two-component system sensor histidine kinase NarQ [Paraferrimonas sedimenticola]
MQVKLTSTLLRLMLIFLVISASLSVFSIANLAFSLGDARAINASGSLRMQSYRLMFYANSGSEQALEKIQEFEVTLHSKELQHNLGWYSPDSLLNQYQQVVDQWQQMKQFILLEDSRSYAAQLIPFVATVDELVSEMENFAKLKLIYLVVSLGIGLLIMIAMVLYAMRFTQRHLIGPINQLVGASQNMQRKEFDLQLGHYRFEEMAVLGEALDVSAKELDTLYKDLQKRVDDQTQALSRANRELTLLNSILTQLRGSDPVNLRMQRGLNDLVNSGVVGFARLRFDAQPENDLVAHSGWPTEAEHVLELPVMFNEEYLGVLQFADYREDYKRFFEQVAVMVSRTMVIQQAFDEREQYALIDERATIARELHDSLGQVLAFLKIQSKLLRRALPSEGLPAKAREPLQAIDDGVVTAYTQLRELLTTFRLTIREPDFQQALQTMVEQLQTDSDVPIELNNRIPPGCLLPAQLIHVLQVAREACINSLKHANANRIIINAQMLTNNRASVVVSDDGLGMEAVSEKSGHFGMSIMQERASRLNGKISIDSEPQQGTIVSLEFPVNQSEQETA